MSQVKIFYEGVNFAKGARLAVLSAKGYRKLDATGLRKGLAMVAGWSRRVKLYLPEKLSENSGGLLLREEKGLGSRASRPMKNARCEGRLTILEAARRGFSDSF